MINNTVSQYFNTSGLLKPTTLKTANTTPNSTRTSGPITGAATLSPVKSATIAATTTPASTQSIGSSYTPQPVVPQVPQPQPAPQPTPQTTPDNPTTFPGLVKRLATTATAGSPEAQDYTRRAVEYGAGSIPIGQQARDIAQQFGQKYADIGQAGARFQAGQLTTGTTPVAEGNAAVTAQTTAAQQTALAQGQQAALQGLGYELTGQQQAAGAAQAGANAALTGQGQAISGLGTAAGLAAPSNVGAGTVVFDPQTGEPIIGGPTQVPYGTQYVNPATGQSVLPNSGQYGTGPAAAANVASIQEQTAQVNNLAANRQSATQLEGQLSAFLQNNNINPSDFNAVNRFLQGIGAQTSSPEYQTYSNLINDLASVYANILTPAGGNATDMTRTIAQSLLNASASGQSIIQVMQNLDAQAAAKIGGIQQNIQNLNTGQNVNTPAAPISNGGDGGNNTGWGWNP